jgi:hypothetical protein
MHTITFTDKEVSVLKDLITLAWQQGAVRDPGAAELVKGLNLKLVAVAPLKALPKEKKA